MIFEFRLFQNIVNFLYLNIESQQQYQIEKIQKKSYPLNDMTFRIYQMHLLCYLNTLIIMQVEVRSEIRARIFMRLKKEFYYSGQFIEGSLYLQAFQNIPYREFFLQTILRQSAGPSPSNIQQQNEVNQIQSYKDEVILCKRQSGFQKGQYQFPFSILLPSTLPSSLHLDANNFIEYTLRCFAQCVGDFQQIETKIKLQIHEPLRSAQSLSVQGSQEIQCCYCFCKQNSCILHMQLEKNSITIGKPLKVKGYIDNTAGKWAIMYIKFVLTQQIVRIYQSGHVEKSSRNEINLYKFPKNVQAGKKEQFQLTINLPQKVQYISAIGSIIARKYFLTLIGQSDMCVSNPRIQKHVIVTDSVPKQQKVPEPIQGDWSPKIEKRLNHFNSKQFIYKPNSAIRHFNQKNMIVPREEEMNGVVSAQNLNVSAVNSKI